MKTIDYTLADFQASMRKTYPPKPKRRLSDWEEMCAKVSEAFRVHPEGYWPTEGARLETNKIEIELLESQFDRWELSFVPETSTKEVLITDIETGEQCWVEVETETNPYSVGLDTKLDKISEQWIKAKMALSNAQTPIEIHDIVNKIVMAAAPSVQKMIIDQSLIKAAYEQVDEDQYLAIKSGLANTQTMRFISELVEKLEAKHKIGEVSAKTLNRITDERLVLAAIKRISKTRAVSPAA